MSKIEELQHAIQTGVAYELEHDPTSGTPKHLRVGVNVALCGQASLARLLIQKGVFTEEEYRAAIELELANEVVRYEEALARRFGVKIALG